MTAHTPGHEPRKEREQSLYQMFVSERDQPYTEDDCFRKSVDMGKVEKSVYGKCRNGHLNNLTENRSTFCRECHVMIRDRRYKFIDSDKTVSIT